MQTPLYMTASVPLARWSPTATSDALVNVIRTCVHEFQCDLCAISLEDGVTEQLAAYGRGQRPAGVNVVLTDANLLDLPPVDTIAGLESGTRRPFRSCLEIPLQAGGTRVGTIVLYAHRPGAFEWVGDAHRRAVGKLAGAHIAEARRHDRTQRLAFVDGLTGFFSRAYYQERLAEAVAHAHRNKEALAVVAYDFDGLKQANETHGYEAGSQLMADTARDQRRHLRRSDIPCRVMGDEYAIIAPHTDFEGGQTLARQIQEAAAVLEVSVPAEVTRTGLAAVFYSAISVGVAALERGDDAESLTRRALLAVQADKGGRRALRQSLQAA